MAKESYNDTFTRRSFIGTSASAVASMAAAAAIAPKAYTAGSDTLRAVLVGCGSRGIGVAKNCVQGARGVELVALADLFDDQLQNCLRTLQTNDTDRKTEWSSKDPWTSADKVKVTPETCFVGFDAYRKVLDLDVDLVLLATPPHFRPEHLRAAVEAGTHVFMEKPVAVDPLGVRTVIASSELAEKKGLAIVAGTQRRHDTAYLETLRRIHDGAVGEILSGQCYWNQGWVRQWGFSKERQPHWSDMEWQIRNWYYFTWLSGDHIVEQHVHNLDVMNWTLQAHPVKCFGMGGRQVRVEPEYGNIFDHFSVEYVYPGDVRVMSMARQIDGCSELIAERIRGSKGSSEISGAIIEGASPYSYDGPPSYPYEQEHIDMVESIRAGNPINEGRRIAESTLTAIMGRISAYTGREISWKWTLNASKLDYTPEEYTLGPLDVAPVAAPGRTKLI